MSTDYAQQEDPRILSLVRDLFPFTIGVVSRDNEPFFDRLGEELPFNIRRYPSGSSFNGWEVPNLWQVEKATISKGGKLLFEGTAHPMAVASYSRSFRGELDLEELKPHLVTSPGLPEAFIWHSMWQYRPWNPDWAFSVPYETYKELEPGSYQVDLVTSYEPGEMLVAEYEHRGSSDRTIVFNAHTCHPHQANDDLAGVAVLVRLFQWLRDRETHYTYRLVLAPEHVGTVFYLRDQSENQLERFVAGAFAEMPGTGGPITVASSFLGDQPIDRAFRNVARHHCKSFRFTPWRRGAGNDETVWEAPGHEVPFVEVSRSPNPFDPYPEYHSSLDTPELMQEEQLNEFYEAFARVVDVLEQDARLYRRFNGLICLSSPQYDLYIERPDPAVAKDIDEVRERWGYLLNFLLRYFDGTLTILEIAEKHELPFSQLYRYLKGYEAKGLVRFEFAPIDRVPISRTRDSVELGRLA